MIRSRTKSIENIVEAFGQQALRFRRFFAPVHAGLMSVVCGLITDFRHSPTSRIVSVRPAGDGADRFRCGSDGSTGLNGLVQDTELHLLYPLNERKPRICLRGSTMPRQSELRNTKRTVDAFTVGEKDTVFWDRDPAGFGVRVHATGRKTYVAQSRDPTGPKRTEADRSRPKQTEADRSRPKQTTIGLHGDLSADDVREQAAIVIDRIKRGEEPVSRTAGADPINQVRKSRQPVLPARLDRAQSQCRNQRERSDVRM